MDGNDEDDEHLASAIHQSLQLYKSKISHTPGDAAAWDTSVASGAATSSARPTGHFDDIDANLIEED